MYLNSSSHELNDSNRRIVGVFPSSSGGFPYIYYEDDFSEIRKVTNAPKVEFAHSGDANLCDSEKKNTK